ncbi:hypothetical protein AC579_6751 [Pseudocercospora musae]|uniref:Folic acid synthesis protein FOL1 n=1 Tax=Pseudocercospora musae TaxID=113226 RepID=A0A139I5D3_9PEZI|nr:hypothetical protein AC579_6751 [Pseudocercospora musae]
MFLLPGIRHGSHLAKPAHGLLLSVRRDLRYFSKVMACRESLGTASSDTLGSLPPTWPENASHGMREHQTAGQLETVRDIVTTRPKRGSRAPKGRKRGPRAPKGRLTSYANLSQETQKVLGLRFSLGIPYLFHDKRASYTASMKKSIARRAVEEFDKTCRHSGQKGLSALAVGTAHLGQVLPANLSMISRTRVSGIQTLTIVAPGQYKSPFVSIGLPSRHVPKVHATGAPTLEETPYSFILVLKATAHPEPLSATSISSTLLPANEEINFLRSTSNMVLSRLCSDLQFETPLEACRNFAEALLRVLRFRTPYLSLASVKLLARSTSGGGNKYIVQATWRDSIDVVTSDTEAKKRQVDVEVIEDGSSRQDNAGIAPQSDPNDAEVAESTGNPDSTEPVSWSRKILQSTKDWCHLKSVSSRKLVSLLSLNRELSEAAKRRFGTSFVSFAIEWYPEHISSLADVEFVSILNTIEAALEAAEDSSAASLICAVEGFAKTVPYVRRLEVRLEDDPDPTYQYGTQNLAKVGARFEVSTDMQNNQNPSSLFKIRTPQIVLSTSIHQGQDVSNHSIVMHTQFSWTCSDLQHWRKRDINDVAKELYARLHQTASSVASGNEFASPYDMADAVNKAARSFAPTLSRAAAIRTSAYRLLYSHNAGLIRDMSSMVYSSASAHVEALIALGSNVGNRLDKIEQACCALEKDRNIRILETSPLYETKAMYVEDQESFVNGVCKIQTNLSATQLLDRLQAIENDLGRVKIIDKGPRNIDLDILVFGFDSIRSKRLTVPHASLQEREFVLRPMSDISEGSHKISRPIALSMLRRLPPSDPPMYALTPLSPGSDPLRALHPSRRTTVMSILNITPDSFSDGGDNHSSDMEALRHTIATHIAEGATIIDIGGQSSRPNAPDISAEEEISRILPAIEAIKYLPEASNITISIDTYRASVAEAAINAGAHIINDISAGLLDPEMLPTIARLGCTYVMMHMRGTPMTMQSEEHTSYPKGLIPTIARELKSRLQAAQEAGIRRWRIILDPGVGFAKTTEQNTELLGKFSELRNWKGLATYPWLVGSSRKDFIGKLTGVAEAKDRVAGTAATVTAAVAGGAEIVRVHDVKETVRVVKMADAMYRSK